MSLAREGSCGHEHGRREFLQGIGASVWAAAAALSSPLSPAWAEEEAEVPVDFKAEFAEVKRTFAGISDSIGAAINASDWPQVQEITQGLDVSFRKRVMGTLRKKIPKEAKENDKALGDDALALCNAVTFDLIGINKGARAGDGERAARAFGLLKDDVSQFLELEKRL